MSLIVPLPIVGRRPSRPTGGPLLGLVLGLLLALASAAEDTPPKDLPQGGSATLQLEPGHSTSTKVVLITDQSISPQTVTLDAGQLVAWMSYSKAANQIVFEREVAKSMICHSLVNFSLVDDELKSALIRPGEFASFCELKPGRYEYKVIREATSAPGVDATTRRLEGEIVVGNPD